MSARETESGQAWAGSLDWTWSNMCQMQQKSEAGEGGRIEGQGSGAAAFKGRTRRGVVECTRLERGRASLAVVRHTRGGGWKECRKERTAKRTTTEELERIQFRRRVGMQGRETVAREGRQPLNSTRVRRLCWRGWGSGIETKEADRGAPKE